MPKKESSKRGYMTKKEVYEHLKGKDIIGKLRYIDGVLSKKDLLSDQTRRNVYDTLTDLYEEAGDFEFAAKTAEKIGDSKRAEKNYRRTAKVFSKMASDEGEKGRYSKQRRWLEDVAKIAEKIGDPKLAIKAYEQEGYFESAAKLAEESGDTKKAIALHKKRAKQEDRPVRKADAIVEAAKVAQRAGDIKTANKLYDSLGFTDEEKERILNRGGGLENRIPAAASMISFIGSFFFLSSGITGNIIGNMTNSSVSMFGGLLFIIGLIGLSLCSRRR